MTYTSEGDYLTDKREAHLLATILMNLENDAQTQVRKADYILSDLIELGLAHPSKGPAMFEFWKNAGPDYRETDDLVEHYR